MMEKADAPSSVVSRSAILSFVLGLFLQSGCFAHLVRRDGVAPVLASLPAVSGTRPPPLWEHALGVRETDFLELTADGHVVVGTVDTSSISWAPTPKDVLLLDGASGQQLWAFPRQSLGWPVSVVATDPVILLRSPSKCVALNRATGSVVWERDALAGVKLLPGSATVLLYGRNQTGLGLQVVQIADGSEVWHLTVDDYPTAAEPPLDTQIGQDAMLITGPQLLAVRMDGKLMWRQSSPGARGHLVWAADTLYTAVDTAVARIGPQGERQWTAQLPGPVLALTADGASLLVQVLGPSQNHSIVALVPDTGSARWQRDLGERMQSALVSDGVRIYVTTPTAVMALNGATGVPLYRTAMSPVLQASDLLPDLVRVDPDRVVVAREIGVCAVASEDGRLLYQHGIPATKPFTVAAKLDKLRRALASITPRANHGAAQASFATASSDTFLRSAIANQELVNALTAERVRQGTVLESRRGSEERQVALAERHRAGEERMMAAERSQIAAQMTATQHRIDAAIALGDSIRNLGNAIGSGLNAAIESERGRSLQSEIVQAFRTHAASLQGSFYVRPTYAPDRGWKLALVDVTTGRGSELWLAADNALSRFAPNLPAFVVNQRTGLVVGKGITSDASRIAHDNRTGIDGWWELPFPAVLAFRLPQLVFSEFAPEAAAGQPVRSIDRALLDATLHADAEEINRLLAAGATVDAADERGATALMLAAEMLRPAQATAPIQALLAHGARVFHKDDGGLTAIDHFALMSQRLSTSAERNGFDLLNGAMREEYLGNK
jgi:outer membrane protein assembly factor BamB